MPSEDTIENNTEEENNFLMGKKMAFSEFFNAESNYKRAIRELSGCVILFSKVNGLDNFQLYNLYFKIGKNHFQMENEKKNISENPTSSLCLIKFINSLYRKIINLIKERKGTDIKIEDRNESMAMLESSLYLRETEGSLISHFPL